MALCNLCEVATNEDSLASKFRLGIMLEREYPWESQSESIDDPYALRMDALDLLRLVQPQRISFPPLGCSHGRTHEGRGAGPF